MPMDREMIESALGSLLSQPAQPWLSTGMLNQRNSHLVKTLDLVHGIGLHEKKIESDPTTTDAGKTPKYKVLADESVPKFAALGRVLGDTHGAIDQLGHLMIDRLTARPEGLDPSEAYGREREIRREIGRAVANAEFLRAVESDDLESARALLNPPGPAWVSKDVRRRGEEDYAKRTNPEAYAKRREVEYLRDQLAATASMVHQWLTGLGADKELAAKTLNLK